MQGLLKSTLTKSELGLWGNVNRICDGWILTYPGGPTGQLPFPLFWPLRLSLIERGAQNPSSVSGHSWSGVTQTSSSGALSHADVTDADADKLLGTKP